MRAGDRAEDGDDRGGEQDEVGAPHPLEHGFRIARRLSGDPRVRERFDDEDEPP